MVNTTGCTGSGPFGQNRSVSMPCGITASTRIPFLRKMSAPYSLNVTVGDPFTNSAMDASAFPLVHRPSHMPSTPLQGSSFMPGMAPSRINIRSLQNGQ
jgi:hypothetical protein